MKIKVMGEWAQIVGSNDIILESHPHNIRKLFQLLEKQHPCGRWQSATVAINHVLYNGSWTKTINEDEDVCILPTKEGG